MSCDKFSFCWDACVQLIEKYMPKSKIYLITEDKKYKHPDVVNIRTAGQWSERLIHALTEIEEDHLMLTLDDFFFFKEPLPEFQEAVDAYYANDMVCMRFTPNPIGHKKELLNGGTFYKQNFSDYRISAQIALWNKEYLMSVLRPEESPWEFEQVGTPRSFKMKGDVYTTGEDTLFYRNGMARGSLTLRGRNVLKDNNIPVSAEMEIQRKFL